MNCELRRTDWVAPPEIIATSEEGCTNTCMLADADFLETVFVTVAVNVYMIEVFNENGGKRYLDGSREVEEMIPVGESVEGQ